MINRIRNFWQSSLKTRLMGYVLLFTLITTTTVPFYTYILSRQALEKAVVNRLETAVQLKESELNRWVKNRENDITLLAQEPTLLIMSEVLLTSAEIDPFYSTSYQSLSAYLQNSIETSNNFTEIFLLTNVGGKIVFSTSHETEGEYHVTAPYFTEGRLDLYTQNIYPSTKTGNPTMTISTPILDRHDKVIGVLAAHLNMIKLDEIILEQAGLGDSGETYLVDQYGNFVSEAKFGKEDFPRGVHTTGIDTALSGKEGNGLYLNYENIPVVGVYEWIDNREVALLAESSQEEAFADARNLSTTIFWTSFIASLIASFFTYFLTQKITKPILAIADTAKEIAAGNLEKRAPVLTKDEVGTLAQSFNEVTERTRNIINTLEERVIERTHILKTRTSYLEGAAEVSRAVGSMLNQDTLIIQIVELIKKRFNLYYVGLFLANEKDEWAILKAGTGEAGQKMLKRNHKLKIGEGMIGWCIENEKARIALDVGDDATRFENPDLPKTRSEGALPLRSRGRVLGALTVQSTEESAFNKSIITTLQTMADQIAIALDNAELFAQSETALLAERKAYGQLSQKSWQEFTQNQAISRFIVNENGKVKAVKTVDTSVNLAQAIEKGKLLENDNLTVIIPIKNRDYILGGIKIRKNKGAKPWTEEELEIIEAISEQLSVTLESARLFDQTQRKAQREAVTSKITAKIGASIRMDAILQTTVKELGKALASPKVSFELLDLSDNTAQKSS